MSCPTSWPRCRRTVLCPWQMSVAEGKVSERQEGDATIQEGKSGEKYEVGELRKALPQLSVNRAGGAWQGLSRLCRALSRLLQGSSTFCGD